MMILYPDYDHSILNVAATLLKHYQAPTDYKSIPVLEDALKHDYNHVILMLLDGMGINIVSEHLKESDFLRRNVKDVITSVFPPTTVAATNAVLSGLPPYASGYLGWVQYFKKENSNCVVFLNVDYYDKTRKFDEILRDKYLSYPTIYTQIEKNSPEVKTYELFPSFRANGFETFQRQVSYAIELTKKPEKNFTYVYWTDPDLTEHTNGIHGKETIRILNELNTQVEYLASQMHEDTLLIVIADHGLTDVKGIDLYKDKELIGMLKRMPSMEPRASNFFVKRGMKRAFKKMFNEKYSQYFMLLSKKELLNIKLLGNGEPHHLLHDFLGDYLAISTSEYMFKMNSDKSFLAHHAGLTQEEMEVPLIIYHQ